MREAGIIFEVKKVTGSPIVVAQKPGGKIRICVDWRKLNAVTKKAQTTFLIVGS